MKDKYPSELNISEARRLLPGLIHALEKNPDFVFRIKHRSRPVAELKAPPMLAKKGLAADKLLALAEKNNRIKKASSRVSEDTDSHLFE